MLLLYEGDSSQCWHLCLDADSDTLLATDVYLHCIHVIPLSARMDGSRPLLTTRIGLPDKSVKMPNGIAISPEGVLFVADSSGRRIVSITVPLV
jgi:sugar lactone lactonase YvrE